jgi:hypothetical protein
MKVLLRIDASARKNGLHSRALADHYQRRWQRANPGGKVIVRDVAAAPVPRLQGSTIAAFLEGGEAADAGLARSGRAHRRAPVGGPGARQHPLYNFNAPSTLKAYVDHVVRHGRTFGDVLLMLQGQELAAGRAQLLERETKLFQTTRFKAMRRIPLRVERQGDLAVECGRQEVLTAPGSQQAASLQARRRFTHILRRTAEGRRFAALMSNNDD